MPNELHTLIRGKLLHVHAEHSIHHKFIDLPNRSAGQGKAECKKRHKARRKLHWYALFFIENRHQ